MRLTKENLSNQITDDFRTYSKKPITVEATQQKQDFKVQVAWQEDPLQAKAGDWLITNNKESWPAADEIFRETYI